MTVTFVYIMYILIINCEGSGKEQFALSKNLTSQEINNVVVNVESEFGNKDQTRKITSSGFIDGILSSYCI